MTNRNQGYIVSIPEGREQEIAEALAEKGVELEPQRDFVQRLPEEYPRNGRCLAEFVQETNRWLEKSQLKPLIPTDIPTDIQQARRLVEMLNDEFEWDKGEVVGTTGDDSQEGWLEMIRSGYTDVFNPSGETVQGLVQLPFYEREQALADARFRIEWQEPELTPAQG